MEAQLEETGLSKVSVEGQGLTEVEFAHQGEAGTVRKAEVLVRVPFEKSPRVSKDLQVQVLDADKRAHPNVLAKSDGNPVSSAMPDDRIALIEHVIGGDQGPPHAMDTVPQDQGFPMVSVPPIFNGQEGACVRKRQGVQRCPP